MSVETLIYGALRSLVSDRVYRDVAPPTSTTFPRIIFQQVGGNSVNFLEGSKPSKKNARVQISCWATRRDTASALARTVEDTLRAVTALSPTVLGAAASTFEKGTGPNGVDLFGTMQDFSFWYDD